MKIGYTGWTWDVDEYRNYAPFNEHHKQNFEQFLREISAMRRRKISALSRTTMTGTPRGSAR